MEGSIAFKLRSDRIAELETTDYEVPNVETLIPLKPRISIFGLGYVGAVSAACFGELGNEVIGVDVSEEKVAAIAAGTSPIVEERLEELLTEGVEAKRIAATTNAEVAVLATDVSFVSVGTPVSKDGTVNLDYLKSVCVSIGEALAEKEAFHVVVIRSTIPPGTTTDLVVPALEEASGKKCGRDFGVAFNPEFLREGTAVKDFHAPPKTVIGATDEYSAAVVERLYEPVDASPLRVSIGAAEMVKVVDNTWHALKVSFGNEVGRICQGLDIDSQEVMDVFVADTKLNLSPYYLRPGFAFGGSCLPKDTRAINSLAAQVGTEVPLLAGILPSNAAHIDHTVAKILSTGPSVVGFLGVTFKAGTDDLREAPVLDVIAELMDRGIEVRVYDPHLRLGDSLRGHYAYMKGNGDSRAMVLNRLEEMNCSSGAEILDLSDTLVVSHNTDETRELVTDRLPGTNVVDLVDLDIPVGDASTYHGLCW